MSVYDLQNVKKFYDDRFKDRGDSIASVGWANVESQELRFHMLLRDLDVEKKTILDVGCGLGDLITFLNRRGVEFNYIGIDISSELIKASKEKYRSFDNAQFFEADMLSFDSTKHQIDIAVLSGTLTYKMNDNIGYAKAVLEKMFQSSREVSAVNFMSTYVDFQNEKNFHYSPEEMFAYGKKLTKKVNLFHDYPLYEFTIQMFK